MHDYLTTKELAELLRVTERKVYDLAAAGEVPCAKVTGKLLFPRRDIAAWLASARMGPSAAPPPLVFLGSHDPLLDWAIRESRCGLAVLFDGSLDGLDRFAAGEGLAAGLHLRSPSGDWNAHAAARRCGGMNAALLGFALRRRGLLHRPGAGISGLSDLIGKTVMRRQAESGAEPLFAQLLTEAGLDAGAIRAAGPARSEVDAALAVARGEADATFGLEALAAQYGLGFAPLIEERFDLLIDRRAWFDAPLQRLAAFCAGPRFAAQAAATPGYDIACFGAVRWNAGQA